MFTEMTHDRLVEVAAAPKQSGPADADRLDWLFAHLNDDAITAKIKKIGNVYAMGGVYGIPFGDFRSAIDRAMDATKPDATPEQGA